MYDISDFEILIKSKLSAEDILKEIFTINPIATRQKYCNDEEQPFAVFVGGIGEDDLVTVNMWLYPLTMKFDDKSIYIDFINRIRSKMKSESISFEKIVLSAVKYVSKNWFYQQDDDNSIGNAKLAKSYIDAYKSSSRERDGYAGDPNVSITDDQNGRIIYGISKFKGTGDLAKCVEVNSAACNLLAFSGFESVLVQGYFTNYNGKKMAHTFSLYKNNEGNYNLLDCILKQQKKDILPGNMDFEKGFDVQYPVVLNYSDGTQKESSLSYICPPQKLITKEKII